MEASTNYLPPSMIKVIEDVIDQYQYQTIMKVTMLSQAK